MSLVTMQKIQLLTHVADAAEVLRIVQKRGVIEFSEVEDDSLVQHEPTEFEFNYVSARLDFAVDFLSDYAPERSGLAQALEGTQERITEKQLADMTRTVYTTEVVDTVQSIQKGLNDVGRKIADLQKEFAALEVWKDADFIVGRDYNTQNTQTLFLAKDKSNKAEGHSALLAQFTDYNVDYHTVSVDDDHIIVTYRKNDNDDDVATLIKDAGYTQVQLEQRRGTPAQECERITRAIMRAQEKQERLEKQARTLAKKHLAELKIMSDHTLWQKDRHNTFASAKRTEKTLVFEGWCVESEYQALMQDLHDATVLCDLRQIDAGEEKPPVEIVNNTFVQPFEAVTRLYGLPGHRDLDPTPFLAGFFFVFFGFCLTDVGYGAILAAVTGYLLWRYDVAAGTKTMLKLLFLGGVASFVAGLFFGGYLGLEMEFMPEFLQTIALFDPIKNPMPVFYFALALGVVQVMTGLVLAMRRGYVYGEFKEAVLKNAPWLFVFVSLIIWGATKVGIFAFDGAIYIIYAALLSLVLTQGYEEKTLLMKAVKGVMSLYDSVAYFADVLSYSRLLALGLATSALAFAVNLIAGMAAGDDGSIVGIIIAAIILVIGHLFNLAINAFGAFIHSARLQFVEFFAKFVTGTGRLFAPFKRTERHTTFRL